MKTWTINLLFIACIYAPHVKANELPMFATQYLAEGTLTSFNSDETYQGRMEWATRPSMLRLILEDVSPGEIEALGPTYETVDGLALGVVWTPPVYQEIQKNPLTGTWVNFDDYAIGLRLADADPDLLPGWTLTGRADLLDWDTIRFQGSINGKVFTAESDGLTPRFRGDANDDLRFNSDDLIQIFQIGKYETGQPASWAEGDFNFDERFDSADLSYAFAAGWYETQLPAAVAVPEPDSHHLIGAAILILMAIVLAVGPLPRRQ